LQDNVGTARHTNVKTSFPKKILNEERGKRKEVTKPGGNLQKCQ